MNQVTHYIERQLGSLALFVVRHKWAVTFVSLLITILLSSQLPKTTMDSSTLGFFHETDPVRVTYEAFQEQFGQDETVVISIEPSKLYSIEFFKRLQNFHEELESSVPHLDEVKSMINTTSTWGEEQELLVEELMEEFPEDEEQLQEKIDRIRGTPLYKNLIISEDEKMTTLLIRAQTYTSEKGDEDPGMELSTAEISTSKPDPLTDKELGEFLQAIFDVVEKYDSEEFKINLAGSPTVIGQVKRFLQTDTPKFTGIGFLIVFIFLTVIFRRIGGLLLPLVVVVFSLLSTLGLMAFFSFPITVITQILPGFLLVVGVCDSVHILSIFYKQYEKTGDKTESIRFAFEHSGQAILLTSLTTVGGMLAFIPAEILPISNLGRVAPVGVLLPMLHTFFTLPALLSIFPVKMKQSATQKPTFSKFDAVLCRIGQYSVMNPWKVICGVTALTLLMLFGISQLLFSHNHIVWLPQDNFIVKGVNKIDAAMKGTVTVEFILDTKKENGLHEPEVMRRLEMINKFAENYRSGDLYVGKSFSIVDTLKNIHKALNENQEAFHKIPDDKQVIAQELLLFENGGSGDLERLVDSQFSKARVTMKLPWRDANDYVGVLDELYSGVKEIAGDDIEVTKTGLMTLLTQNIDSVMNSMAKGYIIAGAIITILMILSIGNLKTGLIAMFPNFLPILFGLGLMGLFGFRLDVSTVLCGNLAIGLVVDDTIHFMHNFQRFFNQTKSVKEAVDKTLIIAGRALTITSLVLVFGFLSYTLGIMRNVQIMGYVTAFIIVMALAADIILLPAIMAIVYRKDDRSAAVSKAS